MDYVYSWEFTLETIDQTICDLMPIFIQQEKPNFVEAKTKLKHARSDNKGLIKTLVNALKRYLKEHGALHAVSDLHLRYGRDHVGGYDWSIECKHAGEPLRVEYTDDWYNDVLVGPPQADTIGWGAVKF